MIGSAADQVKRQQPAEATHPWPRPDSRRDSARAALIYLHMSAERQRAIADRVGKNAKAALCKHVRSGTQMARKAKGTS
jgi:hypothetical protein